MTNVMGLRRPSIIAAPAARDGAASRSLRPGARAADAGGREVDQPDHVLFGPVRPVVPGGEVADPGGADQRRRQRTHRVAGRLGVEERVPERIEGRVRVLRAGAQPMRAVHDRADQARLDDAAVVEPGREEALRQAAASARGLHDEPGALGPAAGDHRAGRVENGQGVLVTLGARGCELRDNGHVHLQVRPRLSRADAGPGRGHPVAVSEARSRWARAAAIARRACSLPPTWATSWAFGISRAYGSPGGSAPRIPWMSMPPSPGNNRSKRAVWMRPSLVAGTPGGASQTCAK